MALPNGASVRLDEWPAVIQSGEEGKNNNSGDKSAHLCTVSALLLCCT